MEEAEDEEWNNNNNYKGGSGGACRVLALGKRFLVAGFVASSVPIVLPPLVVASAIGLAVSMPYAFFYATHACTQNLMSKLLPIPNNTPQQHPCLNHPHITHDDNIQQFKTPFEVTSVVFEESEDQDIEEAELQRETKGLLEKIRDEGRADSEVGEEFKVDNNTNGSQNSMAESSQGMDETTTAEPVGDLLIEIQDYNVSVADEDSSEITTEKIDIHMIVTQEPNALLDRPIILQEGELDNENSDFANQESPLHEVSTYSIDLHEESSNVVVDEHTDSMEVSVSSVENKFRPSECSSGEDIMWPSHQVVFNEESIWKQIHVIRKIIGYEGATKASCADELKALYIFTGVEPPTFLMENPTAEINEKLHFLKTIVGIK